MNYHGWLVFSSSKHLHPGGILRHIRDWKTKRQRPTPQVTTSAPGSMARKNSPLGAHLFVHDVYRSRDAKQIGRKQGNCAWPRGTSGTLAPLGETEESGGTVFSRPRPPGGTRRTRASRPKQQWRGSKNCIFGENSDATPMVISNNTSLAPTRFTRPSGRPA